MTSLEKAKNIAKILDKKKAIDIIGIETKELTVMSDYFIIASGTSNTHVRALADEVDDEMKKLGVEVDHIEGRATGWRLLDYNDVLVHVFKPESRQYYNRDFLDAVAEADSMEEYEKLYITGNLGWQFNQAATEILTQYVCKTDAQYYQEKTNISNGRELPAYSERYHYIYPEKMGNELAETARDGLLVLYRGDLQYLDFSYEVVDTVGEYFLITVQK